MANLTDPLIRAVQGSDPQNLMEYITRQKIYDSRFWKEECFGLSAADVLEKAAKTLTCVGGTFGANQQPSKFLCLTLKLLQLQPDMELIEEVFLKQKKFKYVRILGAFYMRLTGRPAAIYESLEPLYADYSKLKMRLITEWKLLYMDQAIHELLTEASFCGISLPRLPSRETLQLEGFLEEGPRPSALKDAIMEAGGLEEFLRHKALVLKSPAAIALWNQRYGEIKTSGGSKRKAVSQSDPEGVADESSPVHSKGVDQDKNLKKKKKKDKGYGSLFKKDKRQKEESTSKSTSTSSAAPVEGSEEYWNEERAKLGLKPLRK
eukprot:Nitzschia sp. Nitz4//scaffold74_size92883//68942//69901//NITZ4_004831-RA/size92883-processed-gene-0.68-mRNA-1//1//CDS//3329557619//266//frame0